MFRLKILNFSVLEILPALLDKSKTQIIRKSWKEWNLQDCMISENGVIPLEPRFKVGEEVKILWKNKSKFEWFCRYCGGGINAKIKTLYGEKVFETSGLHTCGKKPEIDINVVAEHFINKVPFQSDVFNKHLGNVKITEVFKIEVKYDKKKLEKLTINTEELRFKSWQEKVDWVEDLAKRDGFRDDQKIKVEHSGYMLSPNTATQKMFKTLDKMYDLKQAREFWVTRFKWK